jgi:hypothetical protein
MYQHEAHGSQQDTHSDHHHGADLDGRALLDLFHFGAQTAFDQSEIAFDPRDRHIDLMNQVLKLRPDRGDRQIKV